MRGSLLQLVATGPVDQAMFSDFPRRVVNLNDTANLPTGFNKTVTHEFERTADSIREIWFRITMGEAPAGYTWKPNYWHELLQSIELTIGDSQLVILNATMLKMLALVHGDNAIIDGNTVCFEPFKLADVLKNTYGICMCGFTDSVKLTVKLASLKDCIVPVGEALPFEDDDTIMRSFVLMTQDMYCDFVERSTMCQELSNVIARENYLDTYTCKTLGGMQSLELDSFNTVASAAYIWITDANGQEIADSVVDKIEVFLNSANRMTLTGFTSRFVASSYLPFKPAPNNKSKNLYYIPWYGGQNAPNGAETGINLGRIDGFKYHLYWNHDAPLDVQVHIMHRGQNMFGTHEGQRGLTYDPYRPYIRTNNLSMIFPDAEQTIDVPADSLDMISRDELAEGQMVLQCLTCSNAFDHDLLLGWFARKKSKKCIYCATDFSNTTFRQGRIRLVSA